MVFHLLYDLLEFYQHIPVIFRNGRNILRIVEKITYAFRLAQDLNKLRIAVLIHIFDSLLHAFILVVLIDFGLNQLVFLLCYLGLFLVDLCLGILHLRDDRT